jgi:hypothetical protein
MPVNSAPRPSSTGVGDFSPRWAEPVPTLRSTPWPAAKLVVDQAGSMGFLEQFRNMDGWGNAAALRDADRGSRGGRLREDRLRRLPPCRAADAGGTVEARSQPCGQGSRPQRAAAVPRVREEGSGGGFGQVAEGGCVSLFFSPRSQRCLRGHGPAPFPYPPASWGRSGAGAPLLSGGGRKKGRETRGNKWESWMAKWLRDRRSTGSRTGLRKAARRVGGQSRRRRPQSTFLRGIRGRSQGHNRRHHRR